MTEDDLICMQDNLIEGSKKRLSEHGHIDPVGFIVTHLKRIDKLFETGYGIEFLDPKTAFMPTEKMDTIATLVIDLSMDWKKLYHAALTVFPETQDILPGMLALGAKIKVDDPYKRVMRPFLSVTQLDIKDIIAATMRQICDKTEAFASVFHSETWMRAVESRDEIPDDLGTDEKSIETLTSSMETHALTRMITVPVLREASTRGRDSGKIRGFGEPIAMIKRPDDDSVLKGRLIGFLKPQEILH